MKRREGRTYSTHQDKYLGQKAIRLPLLREERTRNLLGSPGDGSGAGEGFSTILDVGAGSSDSEKDARLSGDGARTVLKQTLKTLEASSAARERDRQLDEVRSNSIRSREGRETYREAFAFLGAAAGTLVARFLVEGAGNGSIRRCMLSAADAHKADT